MSELRAPNKTTILPEWVKQLKSPPPARSISNIANPPGYQASETVYKKKDLVQRKPPPSSVETDRLKVKKAWEVALAPIKGLPMTAIMMYMSGNSLQIFTIMTVYMAFKNPITGLLGTHQVFQRFETRGNSNQMMQVKLAYVAMHLLALALGVWKVNTMGLLPTTSSDWLAWEAAREPIERAVAGI